jgi:hypothetical protein
LREIGTPAEDKAGLDLPNFSAAIRRLVDMGLEGDKPRRATAKRRA